MCQASKSREVVLGWRVRTSSLIYIYICICMPWFGQSAIFEWIRVWVEGRSRSKLRSSITMLLSTGRPSMYALVNKRTHSFRLLSEKRNADFRGICKRWQCRCMCMAGENVFNTDRESDMGAQKESPASSFCIIEGPETVQDFAKMQLKEIQDNIRSRRNKIFLHMEEVRRLRIQQRITSVELGIVSDERENEMPDFPSFIPFLPPLTPANLKLYYVTCFSLITGIIIFGGLLAPALELKLGLGGTSYEDFIRSMHLPLQLSQVDPIVASFSGGAVGVISSLMVVEINNVKQQEQKKCKYCSGTGYLACARCSSTGTLVFAEPVAITNGSDDPLPPPTTTRCPNCLGAGKVMCPTCLCTGMAMASEHDPRIDPFD